MVWMGCHGALSDWSVCHCSKQAGSITWHWRPCWRRISKCTLCCRSLCFLSFSFSFRNGQHQHPLANNCPLHCDWQYSLFIRDHRLWNIFVWTVGHNWKQRFLDVHVAGSRNDRFVFVHRLDWLQLQKYRLPVRIKWFLCTYGLRHCLLWVLGWRFLVRYRNDSRCHCWRGPYYGCHANNRGLQIETRKT